MSYLDGNDLVFYGGSDNQIYSGGFSVNSIMMKSGISPFTTSGYECGAEVNLREYGLTLAYNRMLSFAG